MQEPKFPCACRQLCGCVTPSIEHTFATAEILTIHLPRRGYREYQSFVNVASCTGLQARTIEVRQTTEYKGWGIELRFNEDPQQDEIPARNSFSETPKNHGLSSRPTSSRRVVSESLFGVCRLSQGLEKSNRRLSLSTCEFYFPHQGIKKK
jgi:hypothetical protein